MKEYLMGTVSRRAVIIATSGGYIAWLKGFM